VEGWTNSKNDLYASSLDKAKVFSKTRRKRQGNTDLIMPYISFGHHLLILSNKVVGAANTIRVSSCRYRRKRCSITLANKQKRKAARTLQHEMH
jgi:hypothetical protein